MAGRGWVAAAVGAILVAMAIGGQAVWQDLLILIPAAILIGWGLREVDRDQRLPPRRPIANLPQGRRMTLVMLGSAIGASLLAAPLGWQIWAISVQAAILLGIGMAIFVVSMLARDLPAASPGLARYAPAIAGFGWTLQALGRQDLSPAMFGGVLTSAAIFGWRAWRYQR